MKRSKKINLIITFAVALILLAATVSASLFVTKLLELNEIATDVVYMTNLKTHIMAELLSFILIFMLFYFTTLIIRRTMILKGSTLSFIKSYKKITWFNIGVTFVASSLVSKKVYTLFLMFQNSLPFGEMDSVFSQDIGYYVFQRPFLSAACESLVIIWVVLSVYTAVMYAFLYIQKDMYAFKNILHEKDILVHNIINVLVYFVINIATYKFKGEELLFGSFNELAGAGFTEISVWLNYYKIMPFLLILVVALVIFFLFKGRIKASFIAILSVPAFWVLTIVTALCVQVALVNPYELSMQQKYIDTNIEATRKAFAIDEIIENEFLAENNLTINDIADNRETIDNIRITDIGATLTATNSMQGLRNFYNFKDNDITVYDINGKKTAVCVAVRELDTSKLQDSAKTYVNQHLRFTHGYGLVMNPVNSITSEGQPMFIIKDIPVKISDGAPEIIQPRIYFGEFTNDYVITNSTYKELDYMEGDQNVEYVYTGEAGIPLTPLRRIMYAIKNVDIRLVLSGYVKPESKLLENRNILERAKIVAPFLEYDEDPYIVVDSEGKLKWVIDAYVSSKYYPYSQTYFGVNYIRNSAKVIIDAYDGTTKFYITDRSEPMIMVYNSMYPGLFEEGALPEDIAGHIRYSEKLFKIQSEVYKKYHTTLTDIFHSNSDLWVTAKEKHTSGEPVDVEPYYNLMSTSDSGEELTLILPYTPQGKENLVAWLAGAVKDDGTGRLMVNKFPKGQTVYGTLHIENKIDNDPNISREISLWDQGGSTVFKGNLMVVPVKDALLYVEPIYITTKNSAALPEVKRIVVAYNDMVVMEETVESALKVLFGTQKTPGNGEEPTLADVAEAVIEKYNELEGYSRENDFQKFGTALDELRDGMNALRLKIEEGKNSGE